VRIMTSPISSMVVSVPYKKGVVWPTPSTPKRRVV